MSSYSVRHAEIADKEDIVIFMNTYWGSSHPLINNPVFLNYYFCSNGKLQFCLAEDENGIAALCGYILANCSNVPDIWVSIWCARKDARGAGITLMGKMKELTDCHVIACNNIRENTMAFYTFLGYTALRLPHYYRLADKNNYSVAKVANKNILPLNGSVSLVEILDNTILEKVFANTANIYPEKDIWYIKRRYFDYPMQNRQKYRIFGVQGASGNKYSELLVLRATIVNGVTVLRIVDFIGCPAVFCELGNAIATIMEEENAEYTDFYCYGIDKDILTKAGFTERLRDDENVIPNYLDPPLYENTEYFFFTDTTENFTMFKADGDQDRPNI